MIMKGRLHFYIVWTVLFFVFTALHSQFLYSKIVAELPELGKPAHLRIYNGYLFINNEQSVLVYDLKSLKRIKILCKQGEGPGEIKQWPKLEFALDKLIINDTYKIILFSKDFTYLQEIRLGTYSFCTLPVGDRFVICESRTIDKTQYDVYALINNKGQKIREFFQEPQDPQMNKYFLTPITRARSWQDKIYIAQPCKGFYIDVFDKEGKKLYQIEKDIKKIKAEEKHRRLAMNGVLFALGRSRFERAKQNGAFDRPMMEFVPDIGRFWVMDDNIYVQTYDITDTNQKYFILDLKGNIQKTLFLPIVFIEIFTFHNNTFYYLEDNEEKECWVLHALPYK